MIGFSKRLGFGVIAAILAASSAAATQEVRLVSIDGLIDVSGALIDYDGTEYTVSSSTGTFSLPVDSVACTGQGCPDLTVEPFDPVRIVGTPSVLRAALPELLDAYSLAVDTDLGRTLTASGDPVFQLISYNGEILGEVELASVSSVGALQEVLEGVAGLAVTNGPATHPEGTLAGAFSDLLAQSSKVVGLDALAVVAGADAPVSEITLDDLARILSGEVTNWSAFGGPDMAISVFSREPGSDAHDLMRALITGPREVTLGAHIITLDSDEAVHRAMETFSNAIGVTRYSADGEREPLGILDVCGRVAYPTEFSVKAETYPLTSRVTVHAAPEGEGAFGPFFQFLDTAASREALAFTGFWDLNPVLSPDVGAEQRVASAGNSDDEGRFLTAQKYRATTAGAQQVSLVFRNMEPDAGLDPRHAADIRALARLLRSERSAGHDIMLIGLSEPHRRAADARRNSANAADRIISALAELDPPLAAEVEPRLSAIGYGDALEPDCGIEPQSSAPIRVEVWLKPSKNG